MVQGSISGYTFAFSVSGLDNGEMCFLKNSVAKSGGQTKVADFDDISSITLLLQIKDRRSIVSQTLSVSEYCHAGTNHFLLDFVPLLIYKFFTKHISHLSRGPSNMKQNCTQSSGLISHALSGSPFCCKCKLQKPPSYWLTKVCLWFYMEQKSSKVLFWDWCNNRTIEHISFILYWPELRCE